MGARGGPIKELSWAGRTFKSAGDATVSRSLGGMSNTKELNGDGKTGRTIQEVVPWTVEGAMLSIDPDRGDQEFIQEATDRGGDEQFSCTWADGSIYQGVGTTEGKLDFDGSKATLKVNFNGPGKLTIQ